MISSMGDRSMPVGGGLRSVRAPWRVPPSRTNATAAKRVRLLTMLAVLCLTYFVGSLLLREQEWSRHLWANTGWTAASFAATAKCYRTGQRRSGRHDRRRKAFLALAAGCAAWFVGILLWSYDELVRGIFTPFPSIADIGFLALVPAFIAALLLYGAETPSRLLTLRQLGALGLVATTFALVGVLVYVGPAVRAQASVTYVAVALTYFVLHLTGLVFGLLTVWQRRWGARFGVLSLMVLSLSVLALVTAMYGYSLLVGRYEAGQGPDVFWVVAFAMLVWAAFEEDWLEDASEAPARPLRPSDLEVYVVVLAPVVVIVVSYVARDAWAPSLAPWVVALGLVLCGFIVLWGVGTVQLERTLRQAVAAQEEQFQMAQKMEAVGTLAGGIAHDFNNLLTGILAGAQLLKRTMEAGSKAEEFADHLVQSALRAADLTERLLSLSRRRDTDLRPVLPANVLRRVGSLLRSSLPETVQVVETVCAPDLWVLADAGQLEHALLNLGINAGHAMPEGGQLDLELRKAAGQPACAGGTAIGSWVELVVRDTGEGIRHEDLPRIFEPFFTTRAPGEGTGLGLTMVYATVAEHRGCIEVESEVGHGAMFRLFLPCTARPEDDLDAEATGADAARGWETVLVVDDRDGPLLAAKMILEGAGYRVLIAWNAMDALHLVEEERVDVVLTDAVMPEVGGRALLERLRSRGHTMPVLLMSGYREHADADARGFAAVLKKPFLPAALTRAMRKVLETHEVAEDATTRPVR